MLIKAINLVASDKSRCYDDYLWVCGMIIKMTQYIIVHFNSEICLIFIDMIVMLRMPVSDPAMENSLGLALLLRFGSDFFWKSCEINVNKVHVKSHFYCDNITLVIIPMW